MSLSSAGSQDGRRTPRSAGDRSRLRSRGEGLLRAGLIVGALALTACGGGAGEPVCGDGGVSGGGLPNPLAMDGRWSGRVEDLDLNISDVAFTISGGVMTSFEIDSVAQASAVPAMLIAAAPALFRFDYAADEQKRGTFLIDGAAAHATLALSDGTFGVVEKAASPGLPVAPVAIEGDWEGRALLTDLPLLAFAVESSAACCDGVPDCAFRAAGQVLRTEMEFDPEGFWFDLDLSDPITLFVSEDGDFISALLGEIGQNGENVYVSWTRR